MKKNTKIFLAVAAILTVVAIIAVSYFINNDKGPEVTPTPEPTETVAPTTTPTKTPVPTVGELPTSTPTVEPTETVAPTITEVPEPTKTLTVTVAPTVEPTPIATPVPTVTYMPTSSPTPTVTAAPTATPEPTATPIPHEHVWEVKEIPPTCTENGKTWEECECGETRNVVVREASGHGEAVYTVIKEATLEEEGLYEGVCEICGTVINTSVINKLQPTPTPTSTPVPTATPTPEPTATPKPTATPIPTSTPTPTPTEETNYLMLLTGQEVSTLTSNEPVEYKLFVKGGVENPDLQYALKDSSILFARLEKLTDNQYTLTVTPLYNGKTELTLTLYGEDEHGERIYYDELTLFVKVDLPVVEKPAYNPAEDGYPFLREIWTYEGITVELWTENATSIAGVMIFTGNGAVTQDTVSKEVWTTKNDVKFAKWHINKMYFGEGITEIGPGLPTERTVEVQFPSTLKVVGDSAFYNANLVEAIIPEGVERIEDGAFAHCYELERVHLPSTLKYMGRGAFTHTVQFPDDFENSLLEVTIPKGVEWIGYGAFEFRWNITIRLEDGIDISDYEEGWNHNGHDEPLKTVTE